jgi:predicted negative regulator of RcsB-dependent stress response
MSEEFDSIASEVRFSSFVPLTIFLLGFLIYFGYQDYQLNSQRVAYEQQLNSAMPVYNQAVGYAAKYKALLKDLIDASPKDPAATQILKEAMQAGWISFQPGSNGAGAGASTDTSAPAK